MIDIESLPCDYQRMGHELTFSQTVVVLDFGAQYAQLIARRVREAGVHAVIVPGTISAHELEARAPSALILSGGPDSVYAPGAPLCDPAIFEMGIPLLGICYGHQLLTRALGGEVSHNGGREYGRTGLTVVDQDKSKLFHGLPASFDVWMSHADSAGEPPPGFRTTARTNGGVIAAIEDTQHHRYGVQFHPEVGHTDFGTELISRFVFDSAGLKANWSMDSVAPVLLEQVREQVGDQQVVCGLSGGVDSAVAATLVHQAIGDQLTCIFVDHGFLRAGEAEQVMRTFVDELGMKVIKVDAADRFLEKLVGVTDPETKRRIIGAEFINVFEDECSKLGEVDFLVQGTIYSDWIESGGNGQAATIKSHHNVGGLPSGMRLQLVEPLRELFKDEVRKLGLELGLPKEIVWRQPFPGPGLAIRIIGDVTPERLEIVRQADAIIREELTGSSLDDGIWQAFAILPIVRSVGVQGDGRTYAYPIVIRAVTSDDAMTADWARLPHEYLNNVSARITNEVQGVNRVLFDVTAKPPATIEWE